MEAQNSNIEKDEITIKDIILKLKRAWQILAANKLLIIGIGLLGGLLGCGYAHFQPTTYSSRLTFVLEENKGGGGGLASIAGQFGIDVGGSGGGGLFNGDNILLFLKSQALVRETLLTPFNNSRSSLADQYAATYQLYKKWAKKGIENVLFYDSTHAPIGRLKDSLLQTISEDIIEKELAVNRPDKKASFIEVKTTFRDEQLAKLFCDRLVSVALEKYVSSKVKVKAANVRLLQRRADSLEALLNARTYSAASSQQTLLDINPGIRSLTANPEIKIREKITAQTIYGEVVKNLELAKTIMNQETPAIEIVDESYYPLKKGDASKLTYFLSTAFVFSFFVSIVILMRYWIRNNLPN